MNTDRTAFLDKMREKAMYRTRGVLDALYKTAGTRMTDVDAHETITALTEGVQDALYTWLPPDHPGRRAVGA